MTQKFLEEMHQEKFNQKMNEAVYWIGMLVFWSLVGGFVLFIAGRVVLGV